MEASALRAAPALTHPRVSIAAPLLRFRSDEQLVALFRAGHDDAFRAIHDRYHKRLFAYARQILPARQDAEDALQDVFVRAYSGLRADDRDLALRAWLFRVAHNRCIDELRRPTPPPPEVLHLFRSNVQDPLREVDTRESLRRLITDVRRLPEQQRSALLLRELGGMSYAELATALGTSVGAVKSVLVRARIALAQAAEARDTACTDIREELVLAHDRGMRPNATARRHMRDCAGCRGFRRELRAVNRRLGALAPAVGPLGFLAKVLGISGGASGGATASGATAGGATASGAALASGGGIAVSTGGVVLGAGHVATLIAAAVATAGGAVEIQHTIVAPPHRAAKVHMVVKHGGRYHPLAPASSQSAPGPAESYPVGVAAVQSVTSAAQKAVLAPRAASKRQDKRIRASGSGGGGMIGPAARTTQSAGSSGSAAALPVTTPLTGDGASSGTTATTTGSSTPSSSTTSGSSATANGTGSTGTGTSSGSGAQMNTTNNGSSSTGTESGSTTSGTGSTSSESGSTSADSGTSTTNGSSDPSTSSTPLT